MNRQINRRSSMPVNYNESSEKEDVFDISDVVESIVGETVEKATEIEILGINKKKQYEKALKNTKERNDWEVDVKKNLPKGSKTANSYYVYIAFHPGVFRLISPLMSKFLNDEYGITLKSGKPDRYGRATIKNMTNFKFCGDGSEKQLVINFYPTTSSIDVRLKGSPKDSSLRFHDKGYKTAASFFCGSGDAQLDG